MKPSGCVAMSLLVLAVLLGGCAGDKAAVARAATEARCARTDALVQETQAQLARLRGELADTRIGSAKQEAELQALRGQVELLHAKRAALQQGQAEQRETLIGRERELDALRQERDRLARENRALALELDLAQASPRPSANAETRPDHTVDPAVQAKVDALEASIMALTIQVQHLHQREGVQDPVESRPAGTSFSITVERGDTLGALAARYGVSVDDLRRGNGLAGDLIVAGQQLFVPRPVEGPRPDDATVEGKR